MCLLLGATGVGKTLLLKRLQRGKKHWHGPVAPVKEAITKGTVLYPSSQLQRLLAQSPSKRFWMLELKAQLCQRDLSADLGEPPATLPTVGTNLTDLTLRKKQLTVRELGGCMGPIWISYFRDCKTVIFMVDSANITQISSSCIQLLSVLSAEQLQTASVLVLFNKSDLPCTMSLVEIKSLFRMDDIIASAPQSITVLEVSARSGKGLQEVLNWLDSTQPD